MQPPTSISAPLVNQTAFPSLLTSSQPSPAIPSLPSSRQTRHCSDRGKPSFQCSAILYHSKLPTRDGMFDPLVLCANVRVSHCIELEEKMNDRLPGTSSTLNLRSSGFELCDSYQLQPYKTDNHSLIMGLQHHQGRKQPRVICNCRG